MKKVKLLDGATGTFLWNLAEQAGVAQVPVWRYNIEHPEFVEKVTRAYVEAGSDMIMTNTFGANRLSVEKSSTYNSSEVVAKGVSIAVKATEGTDVIVALDIGPLSELMEPYGDLEEDEVTDIYTEMIKAGIDAGAKAVFLETFIDLEMMRVAAEAALQFSVPVFCSLSFEKSGRTIMGNSVEDVINTLSPLGVEAIGMNCSLGPDMALPIIKEFAAKTTMPLIFKPNAGLPIVTPDGKSVASIDARNFVSQVEPALEWVSYIGGCCGSSPLYIEMLKNRIETKP